MTSTQELKDTYVATMMPNYGAPSIVLDHGGKPVLLAGGSDVRGLVYAVLELAVGSNAQTVLAFTGVSAPWGIAVDNAGTVYVTEHDSNQVMKLASGSNTPTVLPLTGLNTPLGVAVDGTGNIYVADRGNDRAVKLVP